MYGILAFSSQVKKKTFLNLCQNVWEKNETVNHDDKRLEGILSMVFGMLLTEKVSASPFLWLIK